MPDGWRAPRPLLTPHSRRRAVVSLVTVCLLKFKGDAAARPAKIISFLLVVLWAVGAAVNSSKTGCAAVRGML